MVGATLTVGTAFTLDTLAMGVRALLGRHYCFFEIIKQIYVISEIPLGSALEEHSGYSGHTRRHRDHSFVARTR